MKIILSEHQIRTYINESTIESDITVGKERLEEILVILQNDGYYSKSDNNIFKYMGGLPKGEFFITSASGSSIAEVDHDLLITLNAAQELTHYDNIQQFFVFKHNEDDTYEGKGIMLTQANVVPNRKGDMELSPRGAHGGK